jgi:hypothetical protein
MEMDRFTSHAARTTNPNEPTLAGSLQAGVEDAPRHSAAEVRRTIVLLLGDGKRMTPDEVERAISLRMPTALHGMVNSQLRVLQDGEYVEPSRDDSRRLALTESGKRWLSGIQALSG